METNKKLYFVLSFMAFMLVLGTFAYHVLEGWTYFDALYFSTTTLATVGFGDLHPVTYMGKLFTILYVLIGVSSALYAFTLIAQNYFEHNTHHFDTAVEGINKIKKGKEEIKSKIPRIELQSLKDRVKLRKQELISAHQPSPSKRPERSRQDAKSTNQDL